MEPGVEEDKEKDEGGVKAGHMTYMEEGQESHELLFPCSNTSITAA